MERTFTLMNTQAGVLVSRPDSRRTSLSTELRRIPRSVLAAITVQLAGTACGSPAGHT